MLVHAPDPRLKQTVMDTTYWIIPLGLTSAARVLQSTALLHSALLLAETGRQLTIQTLAAFSFSFHFNFVDYLRFSFSFR